MNKHVTFLIAGMLSLVISMGIGRFAYTPILPFMQSDLSFSNIIAGHIASSNYAGYLIGAILTSFIHLKENRMIALKTSLLVSIVTTAFMGITHSNILWYIIRFLSGFASAFVFVLASSLVLEKQTSRNKSIGTGLFYGGVGVGIFLSSLIIPILKQSFQWEGAWIGLAAASLILYIFVWIVFDKIPKDICLNVINLENEQEVNIPVPPNKWLIWLTFAYGLEGLGYIVTGTFIVSIAQNTTSFNNDSTLVWMMVGLAAIPSCILGSFLARRWGYVRTLVLAMSLQSFGVVMPVFWTSQNGFVISALIFGSTFMSITTLTTTLANQMNPANSGRSIGRLTALYGTGQMIGPTIAGMLFSFSHDYKAALIGAAGVIFLGACILLTGIQFEKKIKNVTLEKWILKS